LVRTGLWPYSFLVPERDQLYLLPPSINDWLEEDHLAFFVLDAVDEMDLSSFLRGLPQRRLGGAAHHPATMVALLLYAYCTGTVSSRKIGRACHVDVAFRVICANFFPITRRSRAFAAVTKRRSGRSSPRR